MKCFKEFLAEANNLAQAYKKLKKHIEAGDDHRGKSEYHMRSMIDYRDYNDKESAEYHRQMMSKHDRKAKRHYSAEKAAKNILAKGSK